MFDIYVLLNSNNHLSPLTSSGEYEKDHDIWTF